MILDARNRDEVPESFAPHTVIVGGGTIGLFLAASLARAEKSDLVLEAVGRVADTGRSSETAESIGKPHDGVLLGRATGLGGTSVLWGGQLAEFEEADLVRDGASWPLGYKELRCWYDHVYDTFGIANRFPADCYRRAFG